MYNIVLRYSKAWFEQAVSMGTMQIVLEDARLITLVLQENLDLRQLLKNPVVPNLQKQEILQEIFAKHWHAGTQEFIHLLLQAGRIELLGEICRAYEKAYFKHEGIVEVQITSAVALLEDNKERINLALQKNGFSKMQTSYQIDSSLIGGFVIGIAGKQLNQSVKHKLKEIEKQIKN
jgi:F-type H+-transporting ATPase subunit delta